MGLTLALAPALARDVVGAVRTAIAGSSGPAILLTQPDVRRHVRGLVATELPDVVVLSHPELDPDVTVRALARVSL